MKVRTALGAAALLAAVGTGVARADEPPRTEDESCVEPRRGRPAANAPEQPRLNLEVAAPLDAGPPPALSEPPPTEPESEPERVPQRSDPGDDPWPVEYVLRPQLVPVDRTRVALTSSTIFVDGRYRPANGAPPFHGSTDVGGRFILGVLPQLELSFAVPRVLCVERGQPSPCSNVNRFNGSSAHLALAVLRSRPLWLKLDSAVVVAVTDPLVFAFRLAARAKWLVARRLGLELELGGNRWINPPAGFENATTPAVWVDVEVDVQATRNLLLFVAGKPSAPADDLADPRVQVTGGAAWTFESRIQLGALAGISNVLDRSTTDGTVPVRFVTLSFSFWL